MRKFNISIGEKGFGKVGLTLVLPFVVIVIAYIVYQLFIIGDPVVKGLEGFDNLPVDKTVTLDVENLRSIEVTLYQAGKMIELLKDEPETSERTYDVQVKTKALGLKDGSAIISVKAKSGILKEVTREITAMVDTKPPSLFIQRAPSIITHGGGGFAVLRAKGADKVFIKIDDYTFRAFEALTGDSGIEEAGLDNNTKAPMVINRKKNNREKTWYAFFPALFEFKEGTAMYAVAKDIAGNQSVRTLPTRLKIKMQKKSNINIDDSFINMVVSPLLNEMNIADPGGAFKKVNEQWREEALNKLIEIAKDSSPGILWEGRFLQLKNSKVMAGYGERRSYLYKGKKISESSHLGYDLASFANAPVGAANKGIVKFAGELGIYGNTVIIDHGLGLMSLYGHLSTLFVEKGQAVKKGDVIARTGSTGLAGGDHLHFGMLIHGHEVSPIYWWDPNWLKVSIMNHITIQ